MGLRFHEQFLIDTKGRPKAVVIDIRDYRKLLQRLEDLEDVEYIKAHLREKTMPLEHVLDELKGKRLVV